MKKRPCQTYAKMESVVGAQLEVVSSEITTFVTNLLEEKDQRIKAHIRLTKNLAVYFLVFRNTVLYTAFTPNLICLKNCVDCS